MTVEPFREEKHYHYLQEWWEENDERDVDPAPTLSPFGAVVLDDIGKPVLAMFLYLAIGSKVAFIERLIGKPGLSVDEAKSAGMLAYYQLNAEAVRAGYTRIFAHTNRPGLERVLHGMGFHTIAKDGILLSKTIQ